MADVYLVAHLRLPRSFALKQLRPEGVPDELLARFRREAEILATLRHAHLVDVVDWNVTPQGAPYLVMELLEGEDLRQFMLRTNAPLSAAVALHITMQIGEALHAAHRVGIVHRDLKPSNIFLCSHGAYPNFVKVLDFGIAKMTQAPNADVTSAATVMGTPGYMPPEQILGDVERVDPRADQFSLAAILYEMLAGRPAFYMHGDVTADIFRRVLYDVPEPLPQPVIQRAISRALSKDPADRFPDILSFLAAVGATTHTIYSPPAEVPRRSTVSIPKGEVTAPRREPRGARWLFAAGLVAVLGGAGWQLLRSASRAELASSPVATARDVQSSGGAEALPTGVAGAPQPRPEPQQSPSLAATGRGGLIVEPLAPASAPVPLVLAQPPALSAVPAKPAAATPSRASSLPRVRNQESSPQVRPQRSPRALPRFAVSVGRDDEQGHWQQKQIAACAEAHLRTLRGILAVSRITLVRSGSLKPDGNAPDAVYQSGLESCLANSFSRKDSAPARAVIEILR